MTNASNGQVQMQSCHLILNTAQDLVKTYKIRNMEFDVAKPFEDQSSLLSSNLCHDADRNLTFKDDVEILEFLFGFY